MKYFLLIPLAIVCSLSAASAQTPTLVKGVAYVNCQKHLALPHARVTLHSREYTRTVLTDDQGRYAVFGLPPGRYLIELDTREGSATRALVLDPGAFAVVPLGYQRAGSAAQCESPIALAEPDTQNRTTVRGY
jgi:hypothetical protein